MMVTPWIQVCLQSQDEEKSDAEGASFSYINVDEVSVKEEPASPASSVLSNISDTRPPRRRGTANL